MSRSLKCILSYIIIYLIIHFMGFVRFLFQNNIVIPMFNFIVLYFVVYKPLKKDYCSPKKIIFKNFLIFTTIFNIMFFFFMSYEIKIMIIITISNIIEFIILPVKKADKSSDDYLNEYYTEYYENKKNKLK